MRVQLSGRVYRGTRGLGTEWGVPVAVEPQVSLYCPDLDLNSNTG